MTLIKYAVNMISWGMKQNTATMSGVKTFHINWFLPVFNTTYSANKLPSKGLTIGRTTKFGALILSF